MNFMRGKSGPGEFAIGITILWWPVDVLTIVLFLGPWFIGIARKE